MSDNESGCQSNTESDNRLLCCFRQSLCNRREYDESRIAEDRDRYEESCDSESLFLLALSEELEEGVSHPLGGTRDLKDLPHHYTESDDDAYAS